MLYNHTIEELEEVLVEEEVTDSGTVSQLVVYNDDVNTFEWVIQCFVELVQHTFEQAEQLALIIHYKGRATVKTDSRNILKPLKTALTDRGLSAVIESEKK